MEKSMERSAELEAVTHVLWTGGWDSTFRVLQLCLSQNRSVQPHYLIDPERLSVSYELRAMARVRHQLTPRLASGVALRPTRYVDLPSIPESETTTAAFGRLKQQGKLGGQYEWIARYAEANHLTGLELSVHVDDRAFVYIKDQIEPYDDHGFPNNRLSSATGEQDSDLARVFGRLSFPLLHISKTEMEAEASKLDAQDLMAHTWFCHRPRNGRPCGICLPCSFALEEGMGHRLPIAARIRCRLNTSPPGRYLRRTARRWLR